MQPFLAQIADKILGIIETLLDPKQYDIVRMKRLSKAADVAEKDFKNTTELLNWVEVKLEPQGKLKDQLEKYRKTHESYVKQHEKFD